MRADLGPAPPAGQTQASTRRTRLPGDSDPSAAGSPCLAPDLAYEMACRITCGAVPAPLPARVGAPQIGQITTSQDFAGLLA